MKIALCSSFVPFIKGGGRNIVEWLQDELVAAGHHVERIYLPQVDVPDLLLPQMAAYRWIDLTSSADRIICFRPPAYVIPHPNKILWFIHHFRAYYDLWDTCYRSFPDDQKHRNLRDILHQTDTTVINEARHVFTNSQIVANRLRQFNGIDSEVLYPPVINPERFYCQHFNDEIVYLCRVEHHKRQYLLIQAMAHTRTNVKLRIAGVTSNESYAEEMREMIRTLALEDRVFFDNAWVSEEEKVRLFSTCLAAAYLPLDEDSYGYPSLEASHASKPVLTTTDSGGVLELVKHGYNGFVCEPEPKALAEAMDQLFTDRKNTQEMGCHAMQRITELTISWQHVIGRLLA